MPSIKVMGKRGRLCLAALLMICSLLSFGTAFAIKLPDSDVTKCYPAVPPWDEIVCPAPENPLAQDGSYNINTKSYSVVGDDNDMVLDNNTGLIWQRQGDGFSGAPQDSIDYCKNLPVGGYADWRLPSKKELITLVNYSMPKPGPMINDVFLNTMSDGYWTATPRLDIPDSTWAVEFGSGLVYGYSNNGFSFFARCVRGGQ